MNVTEFLDSDFKNAYPGIFDFTVGILPAGPSTLYLTLLNLYQEMTLLNGENVSSMLIIDIFRLIDMSQAFPDPPRTELLDMNVVQLLASKCTKDNIVDLIRLHQLMKIELAPQVEGAGNLEELENEVEQV